MFAKSADAPDGDDGGECSSDARLVSDDHRQSDPIEKKIHGSVLGHQRECLEERMGFPYKREWGSDMPEWMKNVERRWGRGEIRWQSVQTLFIKEMGQ